MIKEQDFAGRESLGGRETQQDFYAFAELADAQGRTAGLLLVLADGMGGYKGGDKASRLAVEAFVHAATSGGGEMRARLEDGIAAANMAIQAEAEENPHDLGGMGTTLVAASVLPDGLEWVSVGDSALYLFRNGALRRVNADHSMRTWFDEQVREGRMTRLEANTDPMRSRLRSAIMGTEIALIDLSSEAVPLQPGDIVLAATDGLETLDRETIGSILRSLQDREAEEIAGALLEAVAKRAQPRQDNTTVSLVKLPPHWPRWEGHRA